MKKNLLFAIILVTSIYTTKAQTTLSSIQGYRFDKYPAKVEATAKAKLNLASHPLGKSYKTAISEGYKYDKINFGGRYIIITWGAGMGLSLGAMVDIKTGKIIELPLSEDNSYRGGVFDGNNNILYKPNSNLFVTFNISRNGDYDEKNDIQKLILQYFFYKWDGKKFILTGTKKVGAIEDSTDAKGNEIVHPVKGNF